jgi:hypothetical protein
MNSIESYVFSLALLGTFLSMLLYVLFGQFTVRRLRKTQQLKCELGIQFVSGWDIINVAQALALPRSWCRKLEHGPLGSLYANSTLLYKHTTPIDRFIASAFYWLLTTSGLTLICLVLFDAVGLFS